MSSFIIRNGHLIDPSQGIDEISDIMIKDGKVFKVAKKITDKADTVVEASNMIVAPGLVDMHVHLRDPGFTHKEDIITGCNAALVGGVTSVMCMPNTNPVADNEDTIRYIMDKSKRVRTKVYVCAAATKGLRGEELSDYEMYKKLGVRAVSDDGRPVESHDMMEHVMREAQKHGLKVVSHCEDLKIIDGGIINKGKVSEALGVKGMDRLSEDSITKRELDIAKDTDTSIHIAHISTKDSVQALREAKANGTKATGETCPHYFAFTDEKLLKRDADFRMNPPLREQADVEAIINGLKDGTLDCITTDHAPHAKSEKSDFLKAPNGVVGLETSLAAGIKFLVEPKHISMHRLIELMSTNPAKILGINAGSLKEGMPADIIVFDPEKEWTVLPEKLISKSKNSVFKFTKLKGRVKYTFVDGSIAYVRRF